MLSLPEWKDSEYLLAHALVQRALREAGSQPLYKSHPEYACKLLHFFWRAGRLQLPVADYVFPFLETNPNNVFDLLEVCSPNTSINGGPRYRAGLEAPTVKMLAESLGPKLYVMARQLLGPETVNQYLDEPLDFTPPTPENRLRQFIYLYEQGDSPAPSTESAGQ